MPAPTARCRRAGDGSRDGVGVRAADDRGVRADQAERGDAAERGARRLSSAPAAATATVAASARRRRPTASPPVDLAARDLGDDRDVRGDDRGGGQRARGAVRARAHHHVQAAAGRHARRCRPASTSAPGRSPRPRRPAARRRPARAARRRPPRAAPAPAVSAPARPEREARRHAPGRDRPPGPLDGVDLAVGVVVERHPGQVQARGRRDQPRRARDVAHLPGRRGADQHVARHAQDRRQPDQLSHVRRARGALTPRPSGAPSAPASRTAGGARARACPPGP